MGMNFGVVPDAFVKGLRVKTKHLGYRKTISKMAEHTANTHRFECSEFGEVSVADYFLRSTSYSRLMPLSLNHSQNTISN